MDLEVEVLGENLAYFESLFGINSITQWAVARPEAESHAGVHPVPM